jgi:putative ABC transport system substrate-binding protein
MMRRRQFISLLAGLATWPVAAAAQQAVQMRRIGMLAALPEDDPQNKVRMATFRQQLENLGWSEGRNVRIDYRFAAGRADQYQVVAKELVTLHPDVIVANTAPIVAALRRESRAIPIVFIAVSDPIGSGLIASLARPGGNTTGLLLLEASITGKWMAMLKEIAPRLVRAALVGNPKTFPYDYYLRAAEALAPSLGIEVVPSRIETSADIEHAIDSFARVPNGGLVLPPDATTNVHRDLIIALAAQHSLPAIYGAPAFVSAGGLMYYGSDRVDDYRQSAFYVDRILRGANPSDLPVQVPTKYETGINLKTAKALGLTVPPGLLVAADEIIE